MNQHRFFHNLDSPIVDGEPDILDEVQNDVCLDRHVTTAQVGQLLFGRRSNDHTIGIQASAIPGGDVLEMYSYEVQTELAFGESLRLGRLAPDGINFVRETVLLAERDGMLRSNHAYRGDIAADIDALVRITNIDGVEFDGMRSHLYALLYNFFTGAYRPNFVGYRELLSRIESTDNFDASEWEIFFSDFVDSCAVARSPANNEGTANETRQTSARKKGAELTDEQQSAVDAEWKFLDTLGLDRFSGLDLNRVNELLCYSVKNNKLTCDAEVREALSADLDLIAASEAKEPEAIHKIVYQLLNHYIWGSYKPNFSASRSLRAFINSPDDVSSFDVQLRLQDFLNEVK